MVVARVRERYPVLWIGQAAVVTLPAEIDITNADSIREELLSVLNQGAVLLIADLSKTSFAIRRRKRPGAHLPASSGQWSGIRLVVSTPAVQRVLAITGVDRLLDIYPSVAASLAGPSGQANRPSPTCHGQSRYRRRVNAFLERGRRLRRLAAHGGHDRAGDITELHIAVLRGGPQNGECPGLVARSLAMTTPSA